MKIKRLILSFMYVVFSTVCGLMYYRNGGSPKIFGIIIGICIALSLGWLGLNIMACISKD